MTSEAERITAADARDRVATARLAARCRRRSRYLAVAVVASIVLLIVASTAAVSRGRRADRLAQREAGRRAVATAASAFGEALLSYDFNDLEKARRQVMRLATESFGNNYSNAFTGGLSAAITELRATAQATARTVYVSDVNSDQAQAIVLLDSKVNSSAGTRQVTGSYLDLTLLRRGGRWKVDSVTSVAATKDTLTPPPTAPAQP